MWNAAKAVTLLVLFIALAFWLERTTDEAVKQLTSIPRHYWWWGLGTTGGVVLIVWLLKKFVKRSTQTTEVYRRSWFRRPAVAVTLILIGIYGPITYFALRSNEERGRPPARSTSLSQLPAEVALPIIAGCESGDGTPGSGRQFNPDRSIVTNENTDGTIDRGKWQINSRHDAEAKRLNIDLTTEEGNRQFAVILYERNDLRDWKASQRCWEPLLARARGTLPSTAASTHSTTDTTFVVVVRPGQPAEVVMPPNWMIVWWGDKSRFTNRAEWRGQDKVRIFTARGVGSAEIKIHRYYDPDPNWWRHQ